MKNMIGNGLNCDGDAPVSADACQLTKLIKGPLTAPSCGVEPQGRQLCGKCLASKVHGCVQNANSSTTSQGQQYLFFQGIPPTFHSESC